MAKSFFLTVAALTISMASVACAAASDVPPPPELNTTDTTTVTCQKMGLTQGSEQFRNCLDTMKQQEDKLNETPTAADHPDSGKNNVEKENNRHHHRSSGLAGTPPGAQRGDFNQ